MYQIVLKRLLKDNLISAEESETILAKDKAQPMSLFWELNTLLFVGVTLFTAASGYLIYKNLDTIGHNLLIVSLFILDILLFYYCIHKFGGFSLEKVEKSTPFQDYALVTASLLFISFTGYIQYIYAIFGNQYAWLTFIYSWLFLLLAYYFDTKGVLTIALTGFSSWLGIVTVNDYREIFSGVQKENKSSILFWAVVIVLAATLDRFKIKKHFTATYYYFSVSLLYIHLLSELFYNDSKLILLLLLAIVAAISVWYGTKENAYYFIYTAVIGSYIAITYMIFHYNIINSIEGYTVYFIFSGIFAIMFFSRFRKKGAKA